MVIICALWCVRMWVKLCKHKYDMCGGKCLDAAKPTPYFGTARRTVFPSCINLEEDPCVPEGEAPQINFVWGY